MEAGYVGWEGGVAGSEVGGTEGAGLGGEALEGAELVVLVAG